jgi:hypothetical protein
MRGYSWKLFAKHRFTNPVTGLRRGKSAPRVCKNRFEYSVTAMVGFDDVV